MEIFYVMLPVVSLIPLDFIVGETIQAVSDAEIAVQKVAESWLALIDSGKYSESWNEAAQLFNESITKEEWEKKIKAARTSLGQIRTRKLKSTKYTQTLPGASDGHYIVIKYQTIFEKKRSAIETITPVKMADGLWRVSGYHIR